MPTCCIAWKPDSRFLWHLCHLRWPMPRHHEHRRGRSESPSRVHMVQCHPFPRSFPLLQTAARSNTFVILNLIKPIRPVRQCIPTLILTKSSVPHLFTFACLLAYFIVIDALIWDNKLCSFSCSAWQKGCGDGLRETLTSRCVFLYYLPLGVGYLSQLLAISLSEFIFKYNTIYHGFLPVSHPCNLLNALYTD